MHIGDRVPDFTLRDQFGIEQTLSNFLARGPVVLFFYPAAMSLACSRESCHFRDLGSEFQALGSQRIGISMDDVARQAKFTSANQLDYPLLADEDGRVAQLFHVKRPLNILKVKRTTFVIARDQRLVEVIHSELNTAAHADRALAALRTLSA